MSLDNAVEDTETKIEMAGKRLSSKGRKLLTAAKKAIDEYFSYADEKDLTEADAPDYRMASGEKSCATCAYFEGGNCQLYDFAAKSDYVCGSHKPVEAVEMSQPFLFIDLANLTDGRIFDGMVAGSFIDMYGRDVVLNPQDLTAFAKNTREAIERTRTESGELVGLPIDAGNHDKGNAAGWIVGVELVGDIIRFVPKWTEIGVELISKGIRRMFSPTVNTRDKVVLGGALVNWPATTDKMGKVLLRPIELSSAYTFEISNKAAKRPQDLEHKEIADMTDEQVTELVNSAVEKSLAGVIERIGTAQQPLPTTNGNGAGNYDLAALLQLDRLEPEAQERIELALQEQFNAVQKAAELSYMQKLAQVNRKRTLAELATRVTGGTDAAPRGLPIRAEDLTEALLKLPADQVQFWTELCEGTVKNGLLEFAELGHNKEMQGTAELAAPYKKLLTEWVDGGGNMGEFFTVNADVLGSMSQYNLSEFKGGK